MLRIFSRPLYLASSAGVMIVCTVFYLSLMKGGSPERIPVAIVDKDDTSISRRVAHELNAMQSAEVVMVTADYPEARRAMQRGEVYGILEIPDEFYADIASFRQPTLHMYINYTYTVAGSTAYKQLMTLCNMASAAFQREILRKKGLPDHLIMERIQPISISSHMIANPWSNYAIYLLSTVLPGILAVGVLILTIFAIGFELKMQTSREWLKVAGGNYTVAMIGKLLPYTVLYFILGIGCNFILFRFMHFPVNGSYLRLGLAILLLVNAMETMAITIIGLLPTLRDAISVGALYGMLGFSLSGFTYPVMNMLPPIQALTYIMPLRHYYLIYVNEALMAGPIGNTLIPALCLSLCPIFALMVSPRLHNAMLYNNYPLK
jgi:ABC-2 type transport system permease protein